MRDGLSHILEREIPQIARGTCQFFFCKNEIKKTKRKASGGKLAHLRKYVEVNRIDEDRASTNENIDWVKVARDFIKNTKFINVNDMRSMMVVS